MGKIILIVGVGVIVLTAFGVDLSDQFNEFAFGVALCFGSQLV